MRCADPPASVVVVTDRHLYRKRGAQAAKEGIEQPVQSRASCTCTKTVHAPRADLLNPCPSPQGPPRRCVHRPLLTLQASAHSPYLLCEGARPQLPDLECVIKADAQHTRATPRLPVGTLTALQVMRDCQSLACLGPATAAAAVLLRKLPDVPHRHSAVAGTAEQVHAIRVQLQGVDLPAQQQHNGGGSIELNSCARRKRCNSLKMPHHKGSHQTADLHSAHARVQRGPVCNGKVWCRTAAVGCACVHQAELPC